MHKTTAEKRFKVFQILTLAPTLENDANESAHTVCACLTFAIHAERVTSQCDMPSEPASANIVQVERFGKRLGKSRSHGSISISVHLNLSCECEDWPRIGHLIA